MGTREKTDFRLEGSGSLYMLAPMSEAGLAWAEENIGEDNGYQPYWPERIVIEHRYIEAIVEGIRGDGLVVEGEE